MKSLTFYEQQHLQKLLQQQGSVKYLFDDFVRQAGPLLARWSDHNKASVWVGNQTVENSIERLLSDLHSGLLANITDNMVQSWNRGNKKADDLVSGFIKDLSVSDTLRDKMFSRNAEALNVMLNRKDEYGLTVSDRVWNLANGAKDNLEYYLASGLSAGRPSALISQDVRQLLQKPDKRFHRVRDKNGNLVPSQPMKDYHPGQGVYRSAYKNALRLSSTQTNKAFRSADYERWKNMDFVLGIEVERSPSNKGPCPICDAKVGKYSKEYKFIGNHPFCICIATPIMMDHEEFADYLLGDKMPTDGIIRNVPDTAYRFVADSPKLTDNSLSIRGNKVLSGTGEINKVRLKEIKEIAASLKQTTIKNNGFPKEVQITGRSIKEWLNQPHKLFQEKNEMLLDIGKVFENAVYAGAGEDRHDATITMHLFEVKIKDLKSWIITRESFDGIVRLHSISDNESILKHIKKKK